MLMVYLLQARKISSHMSSYQIFRIVLHFLGLCSINIAVVLSSLELNRVAGKYTYASLTFENASLHLKI